MLGLSSRFHLMQLVIRQCIVGHTPDTWSTIASKMSGSGNWARMTSQRRTPYEYTSIFVVWAGRGVGDHGVWGKASGTV